MGWKFAVSGVGWVSALTAEKANVNVVVEFLETCPLERGNQGILGLFGQTAGREKAKAKASDFCFVTDHGIKGYRYYCRWKECEGQEEVGYRRLGRRRQMVEGRKT